jgi:hypothetical protein
MWYWMGIIVFTYLLFILLEESMYYLWNRFVFGPKERKTRLWKSRTLLGIAFLTRLQLKVLKQKHTQSAGSNNQSA